jgi:hypothetical protein
MDGPQRVRRSFVYVSNALQTFTVPANVTTITVEVVGAGGGGGSNEVRGGGGGGSIVTGRMTTTPGATLHLAAGQAGEGGFASLPDPVNIQNLGGWPGGGNAGAPTWNFYPGAFAQGGAGGGYSGIFSANSLTQGNVIIVAGGGEGSTNGLYMGNPSYNGQPGTVSAGGARGGASEPNNTATAGSALQGGEGDANSYVNPSSSFPAPGGGGGYFGGGGGYSGESQLAGNGFAGRGSSFTTAAVVPAATVEGVNGGNGYITLSW